MSTIGIDLENTTYPQLESVARYINIKYAIPLDRMPIDIKDGDPFISWDITEKDLRRYVKDAYEDGSIYDSLAPIAGSAEMIQQLYNRGDIIWILSDRPPEARERTEAWLKDNGIPYHHLAMAVGNKSAYPVDTVIDDNPRQLDLISNLGSEPIMFIRPWNEEHKERFPSFHDWKHSHTLLGLVKTDGVPKLTQVKVGRRRPGPGTNQYALKQKLPTPRKNAKKAPAPPKLPPTP